jgi:DMSO/TMAO reductase YedYZ heme-binding membrane subunit
MRRFLGLWLFFLVVAGVLIYFQKNQGWLSFLGQIPGDMVVRRHGRVLYLPIVSSFFVAALFSLFLAFLSKKEKKDRKPP